jgi:hypothetical protein
VKAAPRQCGAPEESPWEWKPGDEDLGCLDSGSTLAVSAGFRPEAWSLPVGWVYSLDFGALDSCFLISDWWIATAGHVFSNAAQAASRVVAFNYTHDSSPHDRDTYALAPHAGGFIRCDGGDDKLRADFCLVRLAARPGARSPGSKWGTFSLANAVDLEPGAKTWLMSHPEWADPYRPGVKRRRRHFKALTSGSLEGHFKTGVLRVHTACANHGSSGGPMLSEGGSLSAIHSGFMPDRFGRPVPGKFLATPISVVLDILAHSCLTPEQAALIGRA